MECRLLLVLLLAASVSGHGRLTVPTTRDQIAGAATYLQNEPVPKDDTKFVCRDYPASPPALTLAAGGTVDLTWQFDAAHVGDCFVYITYDTTLPDAQQQYFKIAEIPKCKDTPSVTITLPDYLASCDHCVLRWEWYALHVRPTIEYYSQCVDVQITSANTALPSDLAPMVLIGPHLPADGNQYRDAFNPSSEQFLTGPAIATSASGGTTGAAATTGAGTTGGATGGVTGTTGGGGTTGTATGTESRCGADFAGASCGVPCPDGTNSACPAGEACFAGVPAGSCGNRCGVSADDAAARCGTPCPSGTNTECAAGEACFTGLNACTFNGGEDAEDGLEEETTGAKVGAASTSTLSTGLLAFALAVVVAVAF